MTRGSLSPHSTHGNPAPVLQPCGPTQGGAEGAAAAKWRRTRWSCRRRSQGQKSPMGGWGKGGLHCRRCRHSWSAGVSFPQPAPPVGLPEHPRDLSQRQSVGLQRGLPVLRYPAGSLDGYRDLQLQDVGRGQSHSRVTSVSRTNKALFPSHTHNINENRSSSGNGQYLTCLYTWCQIFCENVFMKQIVTDCSHQDSRAP